MYFILPAEEHLLAPVGRVLCTGIELLLWQESNSGVNQIFISMKIAFIAAEGEGV